MIYTIKNDNLVATVNSLGAELTSVIGGGYEYIWQGEEWKKHAPVLFPICGTLLNGKYTFKGREYSLEKHGFAKFMEFEVKESTESSLTLIAKSNEDTLAIYPFEFTLTARYALTDNRLEVTYTVENAGMQIMPYMFGWHPAFTLAGSEPINSFSVAITNTKELLSINAI